MSFKNPFKKKEFSEYNRGTIYGNYSDQVDFRNKLDNVPLSEKITYIEGRDNPEIEEDVLQRLSDMNIIDSRDFYTKISQMLSDTLKKWEKCKLNCTNFFCNKPEYLEEVNGKSICNEKTRHVLTSAIGLGSKDCQAHASAAVDYKKGQVWTNVEEELYLSCSNIAKNLSIISDLLYVYILDSYSENPKYIHTGNKSLLRLFNELPVIYNDLLPSGMEKYIKKLQGKIDAKLGGKRKRKTRKNKSRKNKYRKNKSRKY